MNEVDLVRVLEFFAGSVDTVFLLATFKIWRKVERWKVSVDSAIERIDENAKEIKRIKEETKRIKEVLVKYLHKGDSNGTIKSDDARVPVRGITELA